MLVVEDDEKSRRLLSDVLAYHGFEVQACSNGEDALAFARVRMPAAALLDIQLPGMNGYAVLSALRALAPGIHLPVLAVTASAMEQDRCSILAAGFDACVAKPVGIRELVRTLEGLVGGARR